jgi:hypothetical protein
MKSILIILALIASTQAISGFNFIEDFLATKIININKKYENGQNYIHMIKAQNFAKPSSTIQMFFEVEYKVKFQGKEITEKLQFGVNL